MPAGKNKIKPNKKHTSPSGPKNLMRTSYSPKDVTFLLKDITGQVAPQGALERETLIQSGRHYSEMLPIEYTPAKPYMDAYRHALSCFAPSVGAATGSLCDRIVAKRGASIVLVSLARAGTPAGILIKRYLSFKYHLNVPHYSISIIRDRGIDHNAMRYLLDRYRPEDLLFVDGWTGKGVIRQELIKAAALYKGVSPEIAVLADPANITDLCGTHEDILIPSSCLNSTVCGLVSRTFLRDDIIGKDDFHGAVYYGELKDQDLSYEYIQAIEKEFTFHNPTPPEAPPGKGIEDVSHIAETFGITDINLIKPGIGETTRVLLRRVPWKVLISPGAEATAELNHLLTLAQEKQVPTTPFPLLHYKCCGLIRHMPDT